MKKTAKIMSVVLVALLVFSAFAGCRKKESERIGIVTVTVDIVKEDAKKTVTLKTEQLYLADALVEQGIIEYQKGGMYNTIDGITAEFSKDGAWWYITKNGEMVNQGLNDIKIADGEHYEITYTTEWK